MARVTLDTAEISDRRSFHAAFQRALGFPSFYGATMDAWIDCMSSLRENGTMTSVHLGPAEVLELEIPGAEDLRRRAPDVVASLIDCTAFVNRRYVAWNQPPAVVLTLL